MHTYTGGCARQINLWRGIWGCSTMLSSFINDTSRDFLSLWNLLIILNLTYYCFMWLSFQNITMLGYTSKFCVWIRAIPSRNTGLVKNGLRVALRMSTRRCWHISLAHQCALAAQKTNYSLGCTQSSVMSRSREGIHFPPLLCLCEAPHKVLHPR